MHTCIHINGHRIGNYLSPFIIAEAGINHNGSVRTAKKLILSAKKQGADAVKFQFFRKGKLVNPESSAAGPVNRLLNRYTLSTQEVRDLKKYADQAEISFLVTPFDPQGVDLLNKMGVRFFKIASGDLTNPLILEKVIGTKKPVLLSAGASTEKETDRTVRTLKKSKTPFILLHCVSLYPCPADQANLNTIPYLRERYKCPVGFSDHTQGNKAAYMAALMGAAVIEKHFTLDRKASGPDHKLSMTPEQLGSLVRSIRKTEKLLGTFWKKPGQKELSGNFWGRRGLTVCKDLPAGHRLRKQDLEALRPLEGLPAEKLDSVINRQTAVSIKKGSPLLREMLKT